MKVANERHSKTITQRGHVQKTSVLTAGLTANQLANTPLQIEASAHSCSLSVILYIIYLCVVLSLYCACCSLAARLKCDAVTEAAMQFALSVDEASFSISMYSCTIDVSQHSLTP